MNFTQLFRGWIATVLALPLFAALAGAADLSLRNEIQLSIDRALAWLKTQQNPDGGWSDTNQPAITALVLSAFMNEPSEQYRKEPTGVIRRGYGQLFRNIQTDGGIYVKGLANYNTSLAVMALLAARDPKYEPVLRRARAFIVSQQNDAGEKGKVDSPGDGGVGYGGSTPHADLSNTLMALEALRFSHRGEGTDPDGFNWPAAIDFVQRCQNLPAHNHEPWASNDPANRGGFVYFPGNSKAGETNLADGRVALRSYGSMSYAGLLSYIYADVEHDDPRVTAAYEWLCRNFTLEENPGLGAEGRFYYFHTMAKALSAYGVDRIVITGQRSVNWREALAKKMFDLQSRNGSWVNDHSGRWLEKDPVMVTAYAVLALTHVAHGL